MRPALSLKCNFFVVHPPSMGNVSEQSHITTSATSSEMPIELPLPEFTPVSHRQR